MLACVTIIEIRVLVVLQVECDWQGYLICSGSIMSCIAWLSKLSLWQRLIETIQELICLKGVLLIEMGIHLVGPIQ